MFKIYICPHCEIQIEYMNNAVSLHLRCCTSLKCADSPTYRNRLVLLHLQQHAQVVELAGFGKPDMLHFHRVVRY